ncbi:MAG: glycosyltransferase family 39 protein, partial [Deltaproteobacteria bacterium]|nr:glycosyltransferase family 39 protein [Deltaproteobacteria bacterium]
MEINKQNTIIFFLLLFTGSLIVRIPSLQESLWFDEAYRTFLMLNSDNISKVLFHDVHNFLYNGLMYLWINIFGDSELSIRIPSLLLGYAATFIFCSWTHRKFGPSMALGVLIWVLFSPFHIWYSTEAKNNALVMFFAVSVFVSYANLLENGGWKWVLIDTVAGTLGIFSDFLLMLPLISILVMAVVDLIRNFSKDTLKKILI